jgi:SAM-dependent methyltransferase
MAIDERQLNELLGKAVGDLGGAISALLVYIGDKLGLYRELAARGPMRPEALAVATGTAERYVREWLCNQAAGGAVTYDSRSGEFFMTEEQKACYAEERSPACVLGGFEIVASLFADEPRLAEAFRTGRGVGWHEHDPRLFRGAERFFRPHYSAHLVSDWIPALDGVAEKLERGGAVADVGCGHGASTILLAKAFPRSRFAGFDYHPPSIERARQLASEEGVADRTRFEVAGAKDYPGQGYDLVAFFDCLHDMGDPVGALRHVRETLSDEGTVMLVEPFAGDRTEENLNPIGRVFYGASTVICTMASKAQEVGLALGAQAGEARLRRVVREAGFGHFRRAAATPFNLVFEARP